MYYFTQRTAQTITSRPEKGTGSNFRNSMKALLPNVPRAINDHKNNNRKPIKVHLNLKALFRKIRKIISIQFSNFVSTLLKNCLETVEIQSVNKFASSRLRYYSNRGMRAKT